MTSRRRRQSKDELGPTDEQQAALDQLLEIASRGGTPLAAAEALPASGTDLRVRLRLDVSELDVAVGGLQLNDDFEDVVVEIPPIFPLLPPNARVEHDRFLGHAHVLQGDRLCTYLDPSQEWHHTQGITGFLERLWTWFVDAAAGKFEASKALYHPVGGVLHASADTPTVVVRDLPQLGAFTRQWLVACSDARLDLVGRRTKADDTETLVIAVPGPLRYGAGTTLRELCLVIGEFPHPRPVDMLAAMAQAAARNSADADLYFLLAVPLASGKDDARRQHLIAGRVPAPALAGLRKRAASQGPLLQVDSQLVDLDVEIQWCTVSEQRPGMSTRRDIARPVEPLRGKHVVVWGCGGLGSWMAELVVRAGAAQVTLCDPSKVYGGHLVRQNFEELSIGHSKAEALATRLRSVSNQVDVKVLPRPSVLSKAGDLPRCDVLIDAAVSNVTAVLLQAVWSTSSSRPLVARVCIDRATASLGMLTVTSPTSGPDPETVDAITGQQVGDRPDLEAFRCFWDPVSRGEEITPEPGCSTPTFHGSAADLAATAGSLVSLLGPHLKSPTLVGSHLLGTAHSAAPGHTWLAAG